MGTLLDLEHLNIETIRNDTSSLEKNVKDLKERLRKFLEKPNTQDGEVIKSVM